jgi:hypothetical protein
MHNKHSAGNCRLIELLGCPRGLYWTPLIGAVLGLGMAATVVASENVPHRPFAMWADLPLPKQFVFGLVYEESEAYDIWANGNHEYSVKYKTLGGESYGIDINQGYLALQYGLTEKWALDLNVGATTEGHRYFSVPQGAVTSTTGLMDWSLGVRYQIFHESENEPSWLPTLTFRAGAALPGTYSKDIAFAPGTRSATIEPGFLARKHFGWPGLGVYTDDFFRWNRTTGNDQYVAVLGLFQQIQRWELDAGYRHLQSVVGTDIHYDPNNPSAILYPRDVREINDSIEAGFSYTTLKHHIRLGFHSRVVVDGSNTDNKFWVGGSIDVPFGGKSAD